MDHWPALENPPLIIIAIVSAGLILLATPILALPTALGLSRERSFGQRYWRAFLACSLGLVVTRGLAGLDPAPGVSVSVYALVVVIMLLLLGESLYRSLIGLLAPYAFLMTFFLLAAGAVFLSGRLGIASELLGLTPL